MQVRGAHTNPNYGRGVATIDDDTPSLGDEEARLKEWLDGFLAQKGLDLPRPPRAALEILELSQKPTARLEDIGSLLEREPLLAGRVLKLANSAMYGTNTPITTLKMALVRMGLALVRDVVMEAAFHMTVIRAEGFTDTLEQIRRHSTAVAWLSRFIARNTSIDAENAFLIGLLHDVGLSVALVGLTEFCKREHTTPVLTPLRWLVVDAVHEHFTERVLASWGLPPGVLLVARNHHSLMVGGRPHPNIAILMIAEQIAHDAGWGVTPSLHREADDMAQVSAHETPSPDDTERALMAVNLTRTHYDMFITDTKRVLETLRAQYRER
jgi:HD-like signal output (HDOD) protein